MFDAKMARENVNVVDKAVVEAICNKIERASAQGKRKIYFSTPRCVDRNSIVDIMRELGYKAWKTSERIGVEW